MSKTSELIALKTKGYAAATQGAPLTPFSFERRDLREHDVLIDIHFCGICHSLLNAPLGG